MSLAEENLEQHEEQQRPGMGGVQGRIVLLSLLLVLLSLGGYTRPVSARSSDGSG